MELTTKYHIVPINDSYTYLCLNSNSGYELHEKAEKLPSNLTEILFNNEQTAQRYIDENLLNPQNYKPEAIYIIEELYFNKKPSIKHNVFDKTITLDEEAAERLANL